MTQSSSAPVHRADLAGSMAARTSLGRYIEVLAGLLLGLLMWAIDAAMHWQLSANPSSLRILVDQLVWPGVTTAVFRAAFVTLAIGIGWVLWRRNLRREAVERQEHERALVSERVRTMLAIVNTFRCEVNGPLSFIAENAQMLSNQPRTASDQERLDEIYQSALGISAIIKHLANSAPMYLVDSGGGERVVLREPFQTDEIFSQA